MSRAPNPPRDARTYPRPLSSIEDVDRRLEALRVLQHRAIMGEDIVEFDRVKREIDLTLDRRLEKMTPEQKQAA